MRAAARSSMGLSPVWAPVEQLQTAFDEVLIRCATLKQARKNLRIIRNIFKLHLF